VNRRRRVPTHIGHELLRTFAEGLTTADESSAVLAHLGRCPVCAGQYASLVLKSGIRTFEAPEEIWRGIQSRLDGAPGSVPRSRLNGRLNVPHLLISFAVVVIVSAGALSIALRSTARHDRTKTLDLEQYLEAVEEKLPSGGVSTLKTQLGGFDNCDRASALEKTRLTEALDNYRLVDQRLWHSGAEDAVQLLYESGTDAFALFVIPASSELQFGHYAMINMEVSGLHCSRAECPRQDIYLLTTSTQHYVFVRKHSSAPKADQLFAQLVRNMP
jgi:hypothetical protein